MKKYCYKYRYKFKTYIYWGIGLIFLIFIPITIVNILKLAEYNKTLSSIKPELDIFSIVMSIIVLLILSFLVFNSQYILKEKYLSYSSGLTVQKISYENILLVQENKKTNKLIIFFLAPPDYSYDKIRFLPININKKSNDDFVKDLREKNSRIKFESITNNNEAYNE